MSLALRHNPHTLRLLCLLALLGSMGMSTTTPARGINLQRRLSTVGLSCCNRVRRR
jgi:hypothetical protein